MNPYAYQSTSHPARAASVLVTITAVSVVLLAGCGDKPSSDSERKPVALEKAAPPTSPPPLPKLAVEPIKPPSPAPASPSPVAENPDKALAFEVKKALEGDSGINAQAIDITSAKGSVTLWGTAADVSEAKKAGQIAGRVKGVKTVINKLVIVKGS